MATRSALLFTLCVALGQVLCAAVPLHLPVVRTVAQWANPSAPLAANALHITYLAQLAIGSPPQQLRVVLDTGSANLGVSSTYCAHGHGCGPGPGYDFTQSSTAQPLKCATAGDCAAKCAECTCRPWPPTAHSDGAAGVCVFHTGYVDGTGWDAMVVYDMVAINGTTIASAAAVGAILNSTVPSSGSPSGKRGTMGIALPGLSATASTFWTSFRDTHPGCPDVFGVCLAHSGGVLTLGGVNSALVQAPLAWSPMVTADNLYGAQLTSIQVTTASGSAQVVVPVASTKSGAVIDTGSSALFLQAPVYARVVAAVHDLCVSGGHGWVGICDASAAKGNLWNASECINITTPQLQQWPTLRFRFAPATGVESTRLRGTADVVVNVLPTAYMSESQLTPAGQPPTHYCRSVFQSSIPSTNLGDPFLRSTYVAFDTGNARLGFAHATPGCLPR